MAFSIKQNQLALFSTKVHMHQYDFEVDSDLLADLSLWDLQQAQMDEEAHRPILNEHIQSLCHHLYAMSSHVMASGQMCTSYHSQIWGTCLWLQPLLLLRLTLRYAHNVDSVVICRLSNQAELPKKVLGFLRV